jgi:hypothetical protein
LKQPGSMTGFGHAIFLYSLYSRKFDQVTHWIDVVGPCPSRTVAANSNGRKVRKTVLCHDLKKNKGIAETISNRFRILSK